MQEGKMNKAEIFARGAEDRGKKKLPLYIWVSGK